LAIADQMRSAAVFRITLRAKWDDASVTQTLASPLTG